MSPIFIEIGSFRGYHRAATEMQERVEDESRCAEEPIITAGTNARHRQKAIAGTISEQQGYLASDELKS